MYDHFKSELLVLLALTIFTVMLGLLTGFWVIPGLAMLSGYVAWHLRQIYYLERWMLGFDKEASQYLAGIWRYASDNIIRYQKTGKKRKRRISKLLSRFNQTLEMLPDAIVVMDSKMRIEWMNPAAENLLGINRKRNGVKLYEVIDNKEFQSFIEKADFDLPLEMVSPVNNRMELEVKMTRFENGQYLFTAHDISEVKKVESIRREFLANVSHELRTPLTVVSGYLELLENDELPEHVIEGIKASVRQTDRMQQLVSDLLMLSKIELREDAAMIEESIDVPRLLGGLQSDAQRLSDKSGHRIILQCDRRLGMRGSEKEIASAFGNLIFNAVLHTPEHTQIVISWQQKPDHLVFSVRDTGPGIEEKHLAHLTERFYRIDKARSRERGGTGLGLAITRHVVQRHGGEVKIVSNVGEGTTFTLEFPLKRAIELSVSNDRPALQENVTDKST